MKKLHIFIIFIIAALMISCEKEPGIITQKVIFGISESASIKNQEAETPWNWECPTDEKGELLLPKVAEIKIGDETYFPEVFYSNGKLYTQAIKVKVNPIHDFTLYKVTKFLLRTAKDGPIVRAVPHTDSPFSKYVNRTVDFDIKVYRYEKAEIDVEVLCYMPDESESFGFNLFNINEMVIKSFCFFGDICNFDIPEYQKETAYGGNFLGGDSPWWYYFTYSQGSQKIYAGQKETDGSVYYEGDYLHIDLGSWSLQNVDEPVKIQGFDEVPSEFTPPGELKHKGNKLKINLKELDGKIYKYYIIKLDIQKTISSGGYSGSLYEKVVNGIQMDMPAIFRIDLLKGGKHLPYSPFSNVELDGKGIPLPLSKQPLNENGYLAGTNKPVCARYPVEQGITGQEFTFKLHVWVPDEKGKFHFRLFHTFTATDMGPLMNKCGKTQKITDGILDFALGDCHYFPPDLLIPWPPGN
jgi:hypothetical protein